MKIREYIQVKPVGGAAPDPAVICPANGYIDPTDPAQVEDAGLINNPFTPENGWFLITEFQNNSPSTTTFDPEILADSGEYAWTLGDGSFIFGSSVSHQYPTTATRKVKLYGKGPCTITSVNLYNDSLVGVVDLSHSAFSSLTSVDLSSNSLLTSVLFPASISGILNNLSIYYTGIVGTLDLSMFTNFTSTASLSLYSNLSLTGVTFAGSVSGILKYLYMYANSNFGYVNLSNLNTSLSYLQWILNNNGWNAAIVNQTLSVIDSISVSGFLGQKIYIGGTNAAPDSSSGGFDGIAAKNSLIAKGFTVN